MRSLTIIAVVILAVLVPAATVASTQIVVKVSNVTCTNPGLTNGEFNVLNWQWSATHEGLSSPLVSDLVVSKIFDACSPPLFGLVVHPLPPGTLTLTESQLGPVPKPIMTIQLVGVHATGYGLSGATATAESVSFSFTEIRITNLISNTTFCYNRTTNSTC